MNEDRLVERRFNPPPQRGDDPYVAIPTSHAVTGAPILHRCEFYMDCELVGHLAPDADCRIYLGLVKAVGLIKNPADALQFEIIEPSESAINGKKIYAT